VKNFFSNREFFLCCHSRAGGNPEIRMMSFIAYFSLPGSGEWIPAYAGMTVMTWSLSQLNRNTSE
jgi:hypothetical protein